MKLSSLFSEPEKTRVLLLHPTRATMVTPQAKEDGTIFPAEVSVYRFTHRGMIVAGITVHDLTGLRRREEWHRQEEDRFHEAVYNIPGFLAVYDQGRHCIFMNATAESWLHHKLDDLHGKRDEEILSAEHRKDYLPLLAETFRTKSIQAGTCTFRTGGGTIEVNMRCAPILNASGEVSQVVVTGGGR